MFQYFIQKANNQPQSINGSEVEQDAESQEHVQWERYQMMKEDYQGLFYRKLNLIITLEQSEQAYHQREILMISHRERPKIDKTYRRDDQKIDVHPVTYLAKEMVKRNQILKTEMKMRKKEAEIRVQINKLEIDKKCLLEEITIFTNKIIDIAQQYFQDKTCQEAQCMLMDHGKKYNLSTTVIAFIKEAKQITAHNIVYECLKSSLKKNNANNCKSLLKFEELKLNHGHGKSKRELLEHITLYLKEFKSTTIFKELSQILNVLMTIYDKISLNNHYLYNKITEEISCNLQLLSKINKQLENYSNQIKDYKIQIDFLAESSRITERQIQQLQQKSAQCIAEEAAFLSRQYGQSRNHILIDESFSKSLYVERQQESQTDYFPFFHQQLKQKYQQFIQNQLEDAEHINIIKEKIEDQTINLEKLKQCFNAKGKSPQSQLQTHRTIDQSVFSEFSLPLKEASANINGCESARNSERQGDYQLRKSSAHASLLTQLQHKNQSFLVKKIFSISSNSKNSHFNQKEKQKVYEVKLTKKHLILQQKTSNILRINQKVQMDRIKSYKLDEVQQIISFDCGFNSLKLQFISNSIAPFINKLNRLSRMAKQNHIPSKR